MAARHVTERGPASSRSLSLAVTGMTGHKRRPKACVRAVSSGMERDLSGHRKRLPISLSAICFRMKRDLSKEANVLFIERSLEGRERVGLGEQGLQVSSSELNTSW